VTHAGQLRERIRFEAHGPDANGDPLGPWIEIFACSARIQSLRGTEVVLAQRLEGEQPVLISIHSSRAARALTTDCQAVNDRTGQVYNIKAITPDERKMWLDVLAIAKAGGAVG
jgi:head-tail adaptor